MIRRVFLAEGWLVNTIGALGGFIVGLGICLLQEYFGLLKLGNGAEYVISAYPIAVQGWDIVFVAIMVLLLGALAAWIPAKRIKN
jgi:ABC-type lipoprotein release transport system permease subunit